MSFVVDNSVAISWCIEAERTGPLEALLDLVRDNGAVVPQLWPVEALNVLLVAERRGRVDAPTRRRLLSFLRQLPIRIDDETASHVWTTTAQLSEQHALTAYDATYLELALRLNLPLATKDKHLAAAARASGVALLPTG